MLLALTLTAAIPQTAPAERDCILATLPTAGHRLLATAFHNADGAAILAIARPASVPCSTRHNWTPEQRRWQIQFSAAYAGLMQVEGMLAGKIAPERMAAIFREMGAPDQLGLTSEGAARMDEAEYAGLLRRVGALLSAEKLSAADSDLAIRWFIAFARSAEATTKLDRLAKP